MRIWSVKSKGRGSSRKRTGTGLDVITRSEGKYDCIRKGIGSGEGRPGRITAMTRRKQMGRRKFYLPGEIKTCNVLERQSKLNFK